MLPIGTKADLQTTEIKPEKLRLFRDGRHLTVIVVSFLAVAGFAVAEPGYLPRVGPAALRFRPLPQPPTNHFVLPTPEAQPEPVPPLATPEPFGPMPELPFSSQEPPAITNQVTSGMPDATRPEEVVSPQMLLKYFNKSTNGTTSSIITPLDFTPPKATEAPASKATYSTGP